MSGPISPLRCLLSVYRTDSRAIAHREGNAPEHRDWCGCVLRQAHRSASHAAVDGSLIGYRFRPGFLSCVSGVTVATSRD
eukprot:5859702-Alexandrium_andersonii.AAC.1